MKQECCNLLHTNTLSLLFPFHPPVRIFLSVSARVYETPGVKGEKVKIGRPTIGYPISCGRVSGVFLQRSALYVLSSEGSRPSDQADRS